MRILLDVLVLLSMNVSETVVHMSVYSNSSSLQSTSSNYYLSIPCNPRLCLGVQDLLNYGCRRDDCEQTHEQQVEQFRVFTQGSGMRRHSLVNVHMELSTQYYLTNHSLLTRMVQVNHLDAGFEALDPERLYLGIKQAAELSGSTFGLYSGEKLPNAFVKECTGSGNRGILSDAINAVGAGTNCPQEILLCDYRQFKARTGTLPTDRPHPPTSPFTLTCDDKKHVILTHSSIDFGAVARTVQSMHGCTVESLMQPVSATGQLSPTVTQDDVDAKHLDLQLKQVACETSKAAEKRCHESLLDARLEVKNSEDNRLRVQQEIFTLNAQLGQIAPAGARTEAQQHMYDQINSNVTQCEERLVSIHNDLTRANAAVSSAATNLQTAKDTTNVDAAAHAALNEEYLRMCAEHKKLSRDTDNSNKRILPSNRLHVTTIAPLRMALQAKLMSLRQEQHEKLYPGVPQETTVSLDIFPDKFILALTDIIAIDLLFSNSMATSVQHMAKQNSPAGSVCKAIQRTIATYTHYKSSWDAQNISVWEHLIGYRLEVPIWIDAVNKNLQPWRPEKFSQHIVTQLVGVVFFTESQSGISYVDQNCLLTLERLKVVCAQRGREVPVKLIFTDLVGLTTEHSVMFKFVGLVHANIAAIIMPTLTDIRKILTDQFSAHTTAASLAAEYDALLHAMKNCCDTADALGMLRVSSKSADTTIFSLGAASTVKSSTFSYKKIPSQWDTPLFRQEFTNLQRLASEMHQAGQNIGDDRSSYYPVLSKANPRFKYCKSHLASGKCDCVDKDDLSHGTFGVHPNTCLNHLRGYNDVSTGDVIDRYSTFASRYLAAFKNNVKNGNRPNQAPDTNNGAPSPVRSTGGRGSEGRGGHAVQIAVYVPLNCLDKTTWVFLVLQFFQVYLRTQVIIVVIVSLIMLLVLHIIVNFLG